jgi:hypothetical protein
VTWFCIKDCSSTVSFATGKFRNFDQSGLPVNNCFSHQTSPAFKTSCSVLLIVGSLFLISKNNLAVMQWRRKIGMFKNKMVASEMTEMIVIQ